jgi:hypothetical protein
MVPPYLGNRSCEISMSKKCSLAGVNTSVACESRWYHRDDNGEVRFELFKRCNIVCVLVDVWLALGLLLNAGNSTPTGCLRSVQQCASSSLVSCTDRMHATDIISLPNRVVLQPRNKVHHRGYQIQVFPRRTGSRVSQNINKQHNQSRHGIIKQHPHAVKVVP